MCIVSIASVEALAIKPLEHSVSFVTLQAFGNHILDEIKVVEDFSSRGYYGTFVVIKI